MSKAKWIWYRSDFEIYHNMLLHSRREEKGNDYPPFWHISRPEYACRFYHEYTAEKELSVLISIKGKGSLKTDGQFYPIASNAETEVTLPSGTHRIQVDILNMEERNLIFQ